MSLCLLHLEKVKERPLSIGIVLDVLAAVLSMCCRK